MSGMAAKEPSRAGRSVMGAALHARAVGRKAFLVALSVALVLTLNPAAEYGVGLASQALAAPTTSQADENISGGGAFN